MNTSGIFAVDARANVSWQGDLSEEDFHPIETAIRTKFVVLLFHSESFLRPRGWINTCICCRWTDIEVCWNGSDPTDYGFTPSSESALLNYKL